MNKLKLARDLGVVFLLSACGGAPPATIRGNAVFAVVNGATVAAYAVSSTGAVQTDSPLAITTTDANGNYTLSIPGGNLPSGPVAIQLSSGSYQEEASGATIKIASSKTFTTLLASVTPGGNLNAAVGPLPDIAAQQFSAGLQSGLAAGTALSTQIANADYQVSQAFGLPDVVGVLPANPNGTIPNDPTGQYAIVLTAISQAAAGAGTDSVAIAAAYAQVLATTGSLSTAGGSAVAVTDASGNAASVTPPAVVQLASSVAQIGSGQVAVPGVTPPANFTPPTLTATPSSTAPSGYLPGTPSSATATLTGLGAQSGRIGNSGALLVLATPGTQASALTAPGGTATSGSGVGYYDLFAVGIGGSAVITLTLPPGSSGTPTVFWYNPGTQMYQQAQPTNVSLNGNTISLTFGSGTSPTLAQLNG